MNDTELIEGVLAGRSDRYEVLVSRYIGLVRSVCASHVRYSAVHDDLVQDSFIHAYTKLGTLRDREHFASWLCAIVRNTCRDWLRKHRKTEATAQALAEELPARLVATPEDLLMREELRDWLRGHMARLPESTREAMSLCYLDGVEQKDAADFLGISLSALKKRLQYGRSQLSQRIWGELEHVEGSPKRNEATLAGAIMVSVGQVGSPASTGTFTGVAQFFTSKIGLVSLVTISVLIVAGLILKPSDPDQPELSPPTAVVLPVKIEEEDKEIAEEAIVVASSQDEDVSSIDASSPTTIESEEIAEPAPEALSLSSISGSVTDSFGKPIAKALVRLFPESAPDAHFKDYLHRYGMAFTDDTGKYTLSNTDLLGAVKIAVTALGYMDKAQNLTLEASDERNNIDFSLNSSYDFIGRVLDSKGTPVEGAIVIPLMLDRNNADLDEHWRLSDENGEFSFGLQKQKDFDEGSYSSSDWKGKHALLEIYAEGVGSALFYNVPLTLSERMDFKLPQAAQLSGTVYAENGDALANHTVLLSTFLETVMGTRRSTITDAAGQYSFSDLMPEVDYQAALFSPSNNYMYIKDSAIPAINAGETQQVNLEAKAQVILTGNIIGAKSGKSLTAHAEVNAFNLDTKGRGASDFIQNDESTYQLKFQEPGRYLVGVRYGFFLEENERFAYPTEQEDLKYFSEVELKAGTSELDLTVPEPFVIPVRVVDADGDPIESAHLSLSRMSPEYEGDLGALSTSRRTDKDGRFTWYAMPGKEIWVSASADGLSTSRTPHLIGKSGEIAPTYELVLRKPGDVLGRIVMPDGSPVDSGRVNIQIMTTQGQSLIKTGGDVVVDGSFRIERILWVDNVLVNILYNRRPVWEEPFLSEGPADVDLDLGDIVVPKE